MPTENLITKTQSLIAVTTVSTEVLLQNTFRQYLFIQNQGTDKIWIQFRDAQTSNTGIMIPVGGSYESTLPLTQPVYVIANSGTQNVFVLEGSKA